MPSYDDYYTPQVKRWIETKIAYMQGGPDAPDLSEWRTCLYEVLGSYSQLSPYADSLDNQPDAEEQSLSLRRLGYSFPLQPVSNLRDIVPRPEPPKLTRKDGGSYKCKNPRPFIDWKTHQTRMLGCGRCFWCRREKKVARFKKMKRKIDVRTARGEVPLFLTLTIRADYWDALTPKLISAAASRVLQALSETRQGLRGCSAWPGITFEYLRSPGVTKLGVVHYHALLWVEGKQPGRKAIQRELSRLFNLEIGKALGRKRADLRREGFSGGHQLGGCYLAPCRNIIKAARYICLSQETEANPLPLGLRLSSSKGL